MPPPNYSDIGKAVKDLLRENFSLGTFYVSHKGKHDNVQFVTRLDKVLRAEKILGSLSSQIKFNKYGLKTSQNWTSKDVVAADAALKNTLVNGLKHRFKIIYDTMRGSQRALIKNSYKNNALNTSWDFAFKSLTPNVTSTLVYAVEDYLIGTELTFDCAKDELTAANFALAYSTKDFTFTGSISDWASSYTGGVHQQLSKYLSYAGEISWSQSLPDVHWTAGLQLFCDEEKLHKLKVKVDNMTRVSLSLTSELFDDVKVTICALLHDSNQSQIGFGLQLGG